MKKNKKRDIVLSLLIAIALWSFVVYTTDPVRTKIVKAVPVQITGQESIDERNLTVVDPENLTVDVTVKAPRSILGTVNAEDIHVSADVTDAVIGDNYIPIKIIFDKDVQPASDMSRTVHIRIEKIVNEARKVKIDYEEGAEKMDAALTSSNFVHISGASSKVKEVSYVSALLSAEDISSGQADIKKTLIPVDSDGNPVSGITMDNAEASVHLEGYGTKEVPLNVEVSGEPANGYELVSVDMPETIVLSGRKDVLEEISSIEAKKISLAGLHETSALAIEADIPDGVVAASGQKLVANVVIAPVSSDTVDSLEITDIQFIGLEEGLKAETDDSVTVTGKGISQSKIHVTADLSGLDEGSHKVKVTVGNSAGEEVTFSPRHITVNISRE